MAKVTVHNMPSVYVMETEMPISMVNDLNDYLDEYLEDENKKSFPREFDTNKTAANTLFSSYL